MGWSYRRSVSIGPFRVNASRSGIGYSVGKSGFRTGVGSKGRRYSSFSIPGTGVRYTKGGSGCVLGLIVAALAGAAFAALCRT